MTTQRAPQSTLRRRRATLAAAPALLFATACGSDSGSEPQPDAGADVGVDTATDVDRGIGDAWAFERDIGDAGPYFPGGGYVLEASHVNVVRKIEFTSIVDGVVEGFNLDGETTAPGDRTGCGRRDAVSPAGDEGVDNQLGNLWPALEPLIGTQLQGLLQGAINEGRVLIMAELVDVQDLQNDDDVTVNIYRGLADPDIGTSGFISANQTYELDYDSPISTVEGVAIVDGFIEAGPFEVSVPIDILDLQTILPIQGARLAVQLDEDGGMTGVLGGAFSVDALIGPLLDSGGRAEAELIEPIMRNNADLTLDETECGHMSVAIRVEGTKGYVVRDASRETAE